MFGKIKKVLISLALAASLALAPMNVYVANGTQSGAATNGNSNLCVSRTATDNIETPISVTIADSYSWSVTVPDSFNLNSENGYTDSGNIELGSGSVLGSKTLTVTPNLNRVETYNDTTDYPINVNITGGAASFTATITTAATLEVSINADAWKENCPDGLNDVEVAGITYAIALK